MLVDDRLDLDENERALLGVERVERHRSPVEVSLR
jgi:hypothetical protein